MNLKRYAKFAAPLMMAGLLAACAGLIGPREVELPQERLQTSLDRKFPLHQRALGVFEALGLRSNDGKPSSFSTSAGAAARAHR